MCQFRECKTGINGKRITAEKTTREQNGRDSIDKLDFGRTNYLLYFIQKDK